MSNHLKPCPFCGSDASFNEHTDDCYFTVLHKLKSDPPADLSRVPDLIEAWNTRTAIQQAESVPVAYVCPTSHHAHDGSMEDGPDYLEWADEASDYEKRVGTPLYTHPAPGVPDDVVRDAEFWHYLRHHWSNAQFRFNRDERNTLKSITLTIKTAHWTSGADDIERELSAAMLAASPAQKGGE